MIARGAGAQRTSLVLRAAAAAVAGATLAGCVSEAAYKDALRDARIARIEAAQREQQIRLQQAQIEWLSWAERIADKLACANVPTPPGAKRGGASRAQAAPPSSNPPVPVKAGPRKSPPLDTTDPWSKPRAARGQARGLDALAARPLDADDPWSPLGAPPSSRPPLDSDDPWRR